MKKLNVRYHIDSDEAIDVGTIAQDSKRVFFEYDRDFLNSPHWLSPFTLRPEPGLLEFKDHHFGPIFGLFDDSLPDGWGLLLMERAMRMKGYDIRKVEAIDRLAFMGESCMGALSYHPFVGNTQNTDSLVDLQEIAREIEKVWNGSTDEILPQVLKAGGSPGGARPKILAAVKGDHLITAETAPEGYEQWLIKFAAPRENPLSCLIEFIYSNMAKSAGLNLPETRIFQSAAGIHFGIKRFDRLHNKRIHIQTFGNLIHSNFRIPACDYDDLLKYTGILTKNIDDKEMIFRQAVFNAAAHNRDDHVKNFSFIYEPKTQWRLSPAYDLTFNNGPGGEHSMSLNGKGFDFTKNDFIALAIKHGISKARAKVIIDEVTETVSNWKLLAKSAGLDKKSTLEINKRIESSIKLLT